MKTLLSAIAASTLALALTACGGPPPATDLPAAPEAESTAAAPAAESEAIALPRTPSVEGASVSIISPADGDTVSSPLSVRFAIDGMVLVPAGDNTPESGHHHLLIDTDLPALDVPIRTDEQHLHFGKAQTGTEIELASGSHTLQLLLGDANHVPHDPPVASEKITITVE